MKGLLKKFIYIEYSYTTVKKLSESETYSNLISNLKYVFNYIDI